jgi:hypothetical protein
MTFIFFITSLVITFSIVGYGLLLNDFLNLRKDTTNLGLIGILGFFFLSIILNFTHIFIPHDYFHNLILIIFGLILLSYFKLGSKFKFSLNLLITIFSLLFIGLIMAKTNEDYSYYHLPNSLQFAQQKLQFGLGNINHGFKHISSLFMLNSLFYLPFFDHYLFNLPNLIFLVFFVLFILVEIYYRSNLNSNVSNILLSLFLILFLSKFSRIAEYGSDLSGQIIICIYIFYIFEVIFNDNLTNYNKNNILKLSLLLLVFAITTKFILSIYSLFFLLTLFLIEKKSVIIKKFFELKYFTFLLLPSFFFLLSNFSSTGCVIYPIETTCFSEQFNWALSSETVNYLNFHYEVWSKGGKGPGFEVDNQEFYITSLNWVNNWISVYFFTKVTDYLLVTFTIILLFTIFFKKKIFVSKKMIKKTNLKKSLLIYITIICIFIIWFFNFPSLRYAGYIVFYMLIVFPFIYIFQYKIDLTKKLVIKKISILFLISLIIFFIKNVNRINNELNISSDSQHNFNNFPFYWVQDVEYEPIYINGHKLFKTKGKCWNIPSTCVRSKSFKVNQYKNYIFYSKR